MIPLSKIQLVLLIFFLSGIFPSYSSDQEDTSHTEERPPEQIIENDRGWDVATDNRRINILADNEAVLSLDGDTVKEREYLYTKSGDKIGVVWPLGDTGRKQYVLNAVDNVYGLVVSGVVKIEYFDSGYYNKIVDYESEQTATYEIGSFDTMEISASTKQGKLQPTHIYSEEELAELNKDE